MMLRSQMRSSEAKVCNSRFVDLQQVRMKLACSTNAYTRFTLDEAIRGIRAAGFDGVEILADVPHAYPDAINEALVQSVSKSLSDTGLAVSNINCNCSFG